MEDLLDQLRKKAKLECEDAHRKFVAAKNGLAALHVAKLEVITYFLLASLNNVPCTHYPLTLVLLNPDIYGFKHILSQIICHWNG